MLELESRIWLGPILCFVGTSGASVGKTSLGRVDCSGAGTKVPAGFAGWHAADERRRFRGHRRTYIGALPGQIMQSIRRADTNDPVIMLDELDKLGQGFPWGSSGGTARRTLDPEQNSTFRDNYLDVPFDLSKVLFICTANMLDPIPEPLLDRMEIISLQEYTEEEKVKIAYKYSDPLARLRHNGFPPELRLNFSGGSGAGTWVRHYTRASWRPQGAGNRYWAPSAAR